MTIENWDLGVQDRFFYRHGFEGPLKKEKKVFLFYSLSSVLVIMFSLVSASSNIQGELPPLDFSEERKFFFCTFEQERRFKLLRKG